MTSRYNNDKSYVFDGRAMRSLDAIRQRLYDDRPLSGDQRRDLANTLDAIMHSAEEFDNAG